MKTKKEFKIGSNAVLFLLAVSFLFIGYAAKAAVTLSPWPSGSRAWNAITYTADLDKSIYYPGETIHVTATATGNSYSGPFVKYWLFGTINGSKKSIISGSGSVPTGSVFSTVNVDFTAPSASGAYSANFDSGTQAVRWTTTDNKSIAYTVVSTPVNGSCGSSNGGSSATAPTAGLCNSGTTSAVSDNGAWWSWTCSGSNGGSTATCQSAILASCGFANGQLFASAPTSGFCSTGSLNIFSGTGPWDWTCMSGVEGLPEATCSANKITLIDNAQFLQYQNLPATVSPGQVFTASIAMQNSGDTIWSAGTNYKLGSQNPQDNNTWGIGRLALTGDVAPGQQGIFTGTFTAPTTPGTYNFQWQMLIEGIKWFGAQTTNQTMQVSTPICVPNYQNYTCSAQPGATCGATNAGQSIKTQTSVCSRIDLNNCSSDPLPTKADCVANGASCPADVTTICPAPLQTEAWKEVAP